MKRTITIAIQGTGLMNRIWIAPVLAALVWIPAACGDATEEDGVVARAGSHTLTVDAVVDLLTDEERLPVQTDVVRAIAELWIDYTLLAAAAAEDSTLSNLDVGPLVERQLEQAMLVQLRDSVIQVDTALTDEELREIYEADAPDVQLRARHIMMGLPLQPTTAQRDSVREELESVREMILAGASFESMASQFSQDPGSAPSGGDLGFFARGDMVLPFEEAVLELDPGEITGVVETPMGLHLIRLEERRVQGFADVAASFRVEVQSDRFQAAESSFVAALETRAGTRRAELESLDLARELASRPETRLSARAARRPVVEWNGGALTVGELLDVLRSEQAGLRDQVTNGTDEDISSFLRGLTQRELLLAEARTSGLEPPRNLADSIADEVNGQLRAAARRLGLLDLDRAPGEELDRAIARGVNEAILGNLSGATQVLPLGLIAFQLREAAAVTILDEGIGEALVEVGQRRANRSASPLEESLGTVPPSPDSVGG
jgi:hypothetical protein